MNLDKALMQFVRINNIIELKMINENKFTPLNHHSLMYLDMIYYNKNLTISAIAQMLNVAKSAVTQKVNELVKKGMVEKVQSLEDKRVYYLNISKKAEEEYDFSMINYYNAYNELSNKCTQEELDITAKVFTTFCEYLEQQIK